MPVETVAHNRRPDHARVSGGRASPNRNWLMCDCAGATGFKLAACIQKIAQRSGLRRESAAQRLFIASAQEPNSYSTQKPNHDTTQ